MKETWLKAILERVSKEMWDCSDLASLRHLIGLENSRLLLIQSDAKFTQSSLDHSHLRPASCTIFVYHVLPVKFTFVPTSCCDYFGFFRVKYSIFLKTGYENGTTHFQKYLNHVYS